MNAQLTRVLVVDDDEVDRLTVRRLLRAAGTYEIHEVFSGDDALRRITETTFDCVLLDHHLPGRTGLEMLHAFESAGVDLPYVVLSGQDDPVAAAEMIKAGAADYLRKEALTATALDRALQRALQLHRAQREAREAQAERERALAELRVAYESERAAREEAERAIRVRDEVLSVVSHDLRTPLAAVMTSAAVLQRFAQEPRSTRFVDAILRSAKHMERLISDLLDITRIESGSLSLSVAEHSVEELVRDAILIADPVAREKNIDLQHRVVDCRVPCDRERVLQALQNIISNALKFTPPGGRVFVGADIDFQSRMAVIEVVDNGPGIASDHLPHLFDRFYQVTSDRRGLGLGLSIARGIIDAHRGSLQAESVLGQGATFRVRLPGATPVLRVAPARGTAVVLVVDDDAEVRASMAELLESDGYRTVTAADGIEALRVLEAMTPQLILLDLSMPRMDGVEFRNRQRAVPEWAKIPTVLVTADERLNELLAPLEPTEAITKPVRPQQLRRIVATHCVAASLPEAAGARR